MPAQIAVRLPDALVSWVDSQVSGGAAPSRAVVSHALEREFRRAAAERDAQILREHPTVDLDLPLLS
jgi:Arc/MetJ-type ribon-helix-helix transcriptional regulator